MALTDAAVRSAKPGGKPIKLSDGGGLHLLIRPSGSKLWRLAYRFKGKQKTLALGVYPTVTLANAREGRDEAKKLLARDLDPSGGSTRSRRVRAIRLELLPTNSWPNSNERGALRSRLPRSVGCLRLPCL
jgi:hypothetical protein